MLSIIYIGDACGDNNDGINNANDNCPMQTTTLHRGIDEDCENDCDADGKTDAKDACLYATNSDSKFY